MLIFKLLHPAAALPTRSYDGNLGFDVRTPEKVFIPVGETVKSKTGIAAKFPPGWGALMLERSSQGTAGLIMTSKVIDPKYRGEIHVVLHNAGPLAVFYDVGDRIGQLVPVPVFPYEAEMGDFNEDTARGAAGFGSTGER